MALFSRSKKTTAKDAVIAPTIALATQAKVTDRDLASVIIAPVISEKAMMQNDRQVYTFFVRKDATKYLVHDAITALYKVTPVKVNIVNKLPRTVVKRSSGKTIKQSGFKKAYVYLKAGDSISIA
jgi:large subunit ribosomal protein L23